MTIGMNLKSIVVSGTQILNWEDTKMTNTLHRELMKVKSITEKSVINDK